MEYYMTWLYSLILSSVYTMQLVGTKLVQLGLHDATSWYEVGTTSLYN